MEAEPPSSPSDEKIAQAIRDLNVLGWIQAQVSTKLPLPEEALANL